jgi:hypothetical protein
LQEVGLYRIGTAGKNFQIYAGWAPIQYAIRVAENMYSKNIQACIDAICAKGCGAVREDILWLERGRDLPEVAGLEEEELQLVIKELKSIMSVYGDTCSPTKRKQT